jgi:hypothetical protein
MIDVHLPTTDGREIVLTRYTQPEPELQLLINQLKLTHTCTSPAVGGTTARAEIVHGVVAFASAAGTSSPTRTATCVIFFVPRHLRLTGIISRFCAAWTSAVVMRTT